MLGWLNKLLGGGAGGGGNAVPAPAPAPGAGNPRAAAHTFAPGLALDFYPPRQVQTSAPPAPCVVLIHGGGWTSGSRASMRGYAAMLTALGYACAAIDYRLAPRHRWPAQREDVKAAVGWLAANAKRLGIDVDRFIALGVSAGGHLASLLGVEQLERVRAVVAIAAPQDLLAPGMGGRQRRQLEQLFGPRVRDRSVLEEASPAHQVRIGAPPFLLIHGSRDPYVPYDQAETMKAALEGRGGSAELHVLPGEGHAFSAVGEEKAADLVAGWLRRTVPAA